MSLLKGIFYIRIKPPQLDHFIDAAFLGLTAIIFTFNHPLGLTHVYLAFYAMFMGLSCVKVLMRIRVDGIINISVVTIWYAVFTLFSAMSIWWADFPDAVSDSILRLIQILLVLFAMSQTYGTQSGVVRCLKLISVASSFTALYIFIMTPFSKWFVGGLGGSVTGQNANTIGMVLTVGSLITLYFGYYERKKIFQLLFVCQALCTVLTSSRKSALALLFGFMLLVFLKDRSIKLLLRILLICAATVAIVYIIMNVPEFYRAIGRRFESMFLDIMGREVDGSMNTRSELMNYAKQLFFESPVVGKGLSGFRAYFHDEMGVYTYSHNNYLEILSGLGIVGLALYYWMYGYIYLKLIKPVFRDQNNLSKLIFVMMLVISVCEYGLVSYYSMYTPIFLGSAFLFVSAYGKQDPQKFTNFRQTPA